MKRIKDNCDKYGVVLEAIRMDSDYIMLRKGPERDRMLESIMGNIQKASARSISRRERQRSPTIPRSVACTALSMLLAALSMLLAALSRRRVAR